MNKANGEDNIRLLIYWCAAIIMIMILSVVIIRLSLDNWAESGTFGDTFGSINALFSGLAFAGIIYTIHLQRQELRLQRQELELTRIELRRTADAQEKSEQAIAKQIDFLFNSRKEDLDIAKINYWVEKIGTALTSYQYETETNGKHIIYSGGQAVSCATLKILNAINSCIKRYDQGEDDAFNNEYFEKDLNDNNSIQLYMIIEDIERLLKYIKKQTDQLNKPIELYESAIMQVNSYVRFHFSYVFLIDQKALQYIGKGLNRVFPYNMITMNTVSPLLQKLLDKLNDT